MSLLLHTHALDLHATVDLHAQKYFSSICSAHGPSKYKGMMHSSLFFVHPLSWGSKKNKVVMVFIKVYLVYKHLPVWVLTHTWHFWKITVCRRPGFCLPRSSPHVLQEWRFARWKVGQWRYFYHCHVVPHFFHVLVESNKFVASVVQFGNELPRNFHSGGYILFVEGQNLQKIVFAQIGELSPHFFFAYSNDETVSQPESAWAAGRLLHKDGPICVAISCMGIYRWILQFLNKVPVSIQTSAVCFNTRR